MTQHALRLPASPVSVDLGEIERQPSGHAAIALCATKAGKLDKVVAADLGVQESVWSRVKSGQNALSLDALDVLMTVCGNEAPLHWLLLQRGYDPRSLRKLETESERELRVARERIAELERERAVTVQLLREVRA